MLSETVSQDQFLCIHYYFYYFRIIIQNLEKCNILNSPAFKKYGKFANHDLEKFCSRSLASTIPVFGLERICFRKVGP